MRLNEISGGTSINTFVNDIRTLLGTNTFPRPKMIWKDVIYKDGVLGSTHGGFGGPVIIDLKKSIKKDEKTYKRILAHELCHEAVSQLYWGPKISRGRQEFDELGKTDKQKAIKKGDILIKLIRKATKNLTSHDRIWLNYVNKVNAVYGKGFVTAFVDKSYKF
jgi:hypothetical protein